MRGEREKVREGERKGAAEASKGETKTNSCRGRGEHNGSICLANCEK